MVDAKHMSGAVEIYLAAINAGDPQAVLALFSPDATVEDPVGHGPVSGDDLAPFYERAARMGLVAQQTGPVRVAAQEAAVPFTITIAGAHTRIDVIDVFRFGDDGKITSLRAYWGPTNVTRTAQGDRPR